MTVLETTAKLFKFFSDNDYFETGEHFQEVILISENKEIETATLEAGLDSLVDMEVIIKKESKDKTYWILKKPLSYYEQKVEVAPTTALHIATVLNEICIRVGNVDELCDPLSISDRDLGNLVAFINNVLSPQEDT
jgi:hypothetical protein